MTTKSFDVLIQSTKGVLSATQFPCVLFFDDARRNLVGKPDFVYGFILRASSYDETFPHPLLTREAETLWKSHNFNKTFDGASGITVQALRALCALIPHSKISCIVFDWDLTLSQHRAIIRDAITKKTAHHAAECFFGGQERLQEIKKLFSHAKRHKVPIKIVTSNPAAKTHAHVFTTLLKSVNGAWIPIVGTSTKMQYVKENAGQFCVLDDTDSYACTCFG